MPITINQGMLDTIRDDTDDGWDDNPITYAIDVDPGNFIQEIAELLGFTFDPNIVGTSAGNADQVRLAFALWDDVIARAITEAPGDDDADITVNTADNFPANVGGSTYTTIHSIFPNDADVYLKPDQMGLANAAQKFDFGTAVHEIGHALGLEHPGDYNASDDGNITYEANRGAPEDTVQFTVMSYFDPAKFDPSINWTRSGNHPQTPMIYDILAVQAYYGVDTTTRLGDTTYGFNSTSGRAVYDFAVNTQPVVTIWDAGGANDRLDLSGFTSAQFVDLHEGSYSNVGTFSSGGTPTTLVKNLAIAFGTWIEQAIGGSAADTLIGNHLANYLDGAGGIDTLRAEVGDDTYLVDQLMDNVVELPNEGNDTVNAVAAAYRLSDNVERLVYVGDPNIAFAGTGNGLANEIRGSANAGDTLDGGAGDDQMHGLGGNDLYVVDSYGDQTIEAPNAGNDTVRTALGNYLLQANVENLEFTGAGPLVTVGNELDNIISGNIGDDVIAGAGGDDTLRGNNGNDRLSGDSGRDQLFGGAGDDLLDGGTENDFVSGGDGNDQVSGGDGDDTVDGGAGHDQVYGGNGADDIFGGAGNDDLSGEAGADEIYGGDGNDLISGGAENDVLAGEAGDDAIGGGAGSDTITGGAGNDNLAGEAGVDEINGGDGHDVISGGSENDVLTGEAGDDTIGGGAGDDTLSGGAGNDNLSGESGADDIDAGEGNDVLNGGSESDTLTGGSGDDTISGGDGDDTIIEGAGADIIEGGAGVDTVDYSASSVGVSFDANSVGTSGDALGDRLQNIEILIGTAFADVLYGDAGDDMLLGGDGDDTLNGLAGNDALDGGLGGDAMSGGFGDDVYRVDSVQDVVSELPAQGEDRVDTTLDTYALTPNVENLTYIGAADFVGAGNELANVITGGAGDDVLSGGPGGDWLKGEGGSDTADYSTSPTAVSVNLQTGATSGGDAVGDTFDSIENLTGSAFIDVLTGDEGDNVLLGGVGDDTLNGGGGNDTLYGGHGRDLLVGGLGDDLYIIDDAGPQTSFDRLTELANGGNDTVRSETQTLDLTRARLANIENAELTGFGNFNLIGTSVANVLKGNDGVNRVFGGGGLDTLLGGAGADVFDYDSTSDALPAVSGEFILDFQAGVDKIDLSNIDADTGKGGNGTFSFIGDLAFTAAGQLRCFFDGTNTVVQCNVDANLAADLEITLLGQHSLAGADFFG